MWEDWVNISHLTLCISLIMLIRTIKKAYGISNIASSPTSKRCSPANTAMLPCFPVPESVSSSHENTSKSVHQCIWSVYLHLRHHGISQPLFLDEPFFQKSESIFIVFTNRKISFVFCSRGMGCRNVTIIIRSCR